MNIKVMTFNLRIMTDADGINRFDKRFWRVVKTIRDELPDLVGFQEATTEMKRMLEKEISDIYMVVGCGRKCNYRGESVCIGYRKDIFELVNLETYWLSDTPNVAGSRYENSDQSQCARLAVCAQLSPEGSNECIFFHNTHLDHKGEQARVLEIQQVIEKIKSYGGKFILTGDMNDFPDSECMGLVKSVEGVTDATAELKHTFHNYGRNDKDCKIDYIYTNATALKAYTVEDIPVEGVYISDHYPVCAEIEI